MKKKDSKNLDLSQILAEAGYQPNQITVLYNLLEENIIEAARMNTFINVGTLFKIKFSKRAKKNVVPIMSLKRHFSARLRYHGAKKYSDETLEQDAST